MFIMTSTTDTNVKDRYNIVYCSAFFIGMSIYFPWNILINVTSYWNYKLRNVSADNQSLHRLILGEDEEGETLTELQKIYNSYLSIASMVPNAIIMILHAFIGHKFSIRLRLYGSQVIIFFSFNNYISL